MATINASMALTSKLVSVRFNDDGSHSLVFELLDTHGNTFETRSYNLRADGNVADAETGTIISSTIPPRILTALNNVGLDADAIMDTANKAGTVAV